MNYQKHNQRKKKLNMHQVHQSVGTQLVENYLQDSPMEKLEFGNLNKEQPSKNEKINNNKFMFKLLLLLKML